MRGRIVLLVCTLVLAVMPAANATLTCSSNCHFPSPRQCATGHDDGVWNGGGNPGHGAVCAGTGGVDLVYAGGDPVAGCGTVIVANENVVDGPSAGNTGDPNHCPYNGWTAQVHDPSVAKDRGIYYVFGTGNGLPILTSTDLVHWTHDGQILAGAVPSWAPSTIPGAVNTWAPDISFFDGVWHVYYAVSTFGAKTSAIGFATSPSLADPTWTDHGPVVESNEATPYNAIDPNIVIAPDGTISLVFGSFNGGIYVVPIDPSTGAPSASSEPLPIASRIVTTWGIEGAFVAQHGGYYYLFVSFDDCCRGSDSTYNIRVGRSRSLDGPFLDDRGVPMLAGGGRVVLRSSGTDRGPGHNAVLNDGGTWRLFFHYYDAAEGGTSRLGILPITWTSTGWPAVHWSDLHPTTIG